MGYESRLFHIITPPTSLDGCGFFNSIIVWLPFNSISNSSEWGLFYNLIVILMWLCEEASCVYLYHHVWGVYLFLYCGLFPSMIFFSKLFFLFHGKIYDQLDTFSVGVFSFLVTQSVGRFLCSLFSCFTYVAFETIVYNFLYYIIHHWIC